MLTIWVMIVLVVSGFFAGYRICLLVQKYRAMETLAEGKGRITNGKR